MLGIGNSVVRLKICFDGEGKEFINNEWEVVFKEIKKL